MKKKLTAYEKYSFCFIKKISEPPIERFDNCNGFDKIILMSPFATWKPCTLPYILKFHISALCIFERRKVSRES